MSNLFNRNGLFVSEVDINRQHQYIEEYLKQIGMGVRLYKVDKQRTTTDDIYNQTHLYDIKFQPPIDFYALVTIGSTTSAAYNENGTIRYENPGNIEFSIYTPYMERIKCEINYGDYICYYFTPTNYAFYEIVDDNKKNYESKNTILGRDYNWRRIQATAAQVTENYFK